MKSIISENRASEEYAGKIFEKFYNNINIRKNCAQILADSILLANSISTSCWSLTLFPNKIRLNVGPVEVLVLKFETIFIIITEPKYDRLKNIKYESYIEPAKIHYKSIKTEHCLCNIPQEIIAQFYPEISKNHQEFINLAAEHKKNTTWKSSFSIGLIHYLNKLLNISLPTPAYITNNNQDQCLFPDQINTNTIYSEGSVSTILVNSYERNLRARKICIDHYGARCSICNIKFEEIYGAIGKDFIHVHHLKPISEINKEYIVDPIIDLIPVCPNCHAMMHQRNPPFSIDKIKMFLRKNTLSDS
jgi:5-methylcytosine-specific restriction protein A